VESFALNTLIEAFGSLTFEALSIIIPLTKLGALPVVDVWENVVKDSRQK
jgi:hypothetical protein